MGLLETAEELLLFCYHGNAALLRQDVVAASSGFISVEVPMLQLLQSKPSVHHAFMSAPDQVALAASYLCTRLRGASARAVPLQVYFRPRCSTAAPCTSSEQFAELLSRSTQARPVTTSLQGRVVQNSNVFRAAHAVLFSCQACGQTVAVRQVDATLGGAECPCGGRLRAEASAERPVVHAVQSIRLDLPASRGAVSRSIDLELSGSDLVDRLQLGAWAEAILKCRPTGLSGPHGARVTHTLEVLNAQHVATSVLREQQCRRPIPAPPALGKRPLHQLMHALEVATGVAPHAHLGWYVPLSLLLSAVAVGEELRASKLPGQSSAHRCQVQLLLVGDDIPDVIRRVIGAAAAVLSPDVHHIDSRATLHVKASRDAAGVTHAHGSPLLDASQGIAIARIAGHTAVQRQALLEHLAAASAAPRGSAGAAQMREVPHTATCWLLHNARDAARAASDAVQSVRETYGPALLSVVDLVVPVGTEDLGNAAMEVALAVPVGGDLAEAQGGATAARDVLREWLLHAARVDAPIMGEAAMRVLQSYFATLRAGRAAHKAETSIGTLSTLMRLAMASARLHMRGAADTLDAMLAIRLVEESTRVRLQGAAAPLLGDSMLDLAEGTRSGEGRTFDEYLDMLVANFGQCAAGREE